MLLPLPVLRIQLDGGKTAAFTASRGTRVRVVKGRVWATTTGSREDVWIDAGEEHHVQKRGLTVLEADRRRATVELSPPAYGTRSTLRRVVCGIAAAVLTGLTMVVLVILPAQWDASSRVQQDLVQASSTAEATK